LYELEKIFKTLLLESGLDQNEHFWGLFHRTPSGLTFYEQWEKLESEIVRETPPTIHESFRLDRSYAYGIGLFIILDVDVIDRAAIEQAITKFLLISETDWQAAIPVPRERLPVVSEKEALAAI